MADMPPDPNGGEGSQFWAVVAGLAAGAIWRAPRWFTKMGVNWELLVRDVASLGVLAIVSVAICRVFSLDGEYAALVGAAVSVAGIDTIRKYATDAFHQWAKARGVDFSKRKGKPEAEAEE